MIPGALVQAATEEWYTPRWLLNAVVDVLDGIDLDPAAESRETPNVPAERHFTLEDDGLRREWNGRVFLNPPYGRALSAWVGHLLWEYDTGRCSAAIAVLPASVETGWFAPLWRHCICFYRGRVRFIDGVTGDTPALGIPTPICIVYLGSERLRFISRFSEFGPIATDLRQTHSQSPLVLSLYDPVPDPWQDPEEDRLLIAARNGA